ncbi:Addiction module toxin, RelE/StbE family [Candidatus Promineifilum breve]|uniref:Addiction module toxin, RelE/StbE family n=1 Tax=Candidatus Promineifilum breve TaxID=1806508 RepID=A0A170PIS9_9CHLR|nr:type II toxin-antitoxin system RelE/ParE family toxin [Candidatus Promineifilum breve]CUS05007.2 Addiction module toxin, RelE/StbE family [Candidatus Promineifilum breve]
MYQVSFSKEAQKALLKLPRPLALKIREKLTAVARDPYAQHNNVSKLQNRPGYRLRIGDWRVIYEIRGDELVILVVKIAPRGEVYR